MRFASMRNKVHERIEFLENELRAVNYRLDHLQKFYSINQIRVWRKSKRTLKLKLKELHFVAKLIKQAQPMKSLLLELAPYGRGSVVGTKSKSQSATQ